MLIIDARYIDTNIYTLFTTYTQQSLKVDV